MASETGTLYIKSADWSQNIYQNSSYNFLSSETLSACLSTNAPTVAYAALTIGWTAISDSISMGELYATYAVSGALTLYDVTPIPAETITGFYLDWTEYQFAWGGWDWDVTWPSSSTDWDVALFDWTTWKLIKDSWVALSSKANDSDVVKLSWNQTIAWTKTFSTSPVVPAKSSDASSSNTTVVATEAQVAKKQNTLSTAQLNAANSWITSDKVSTYDWYATTIWNKANTSDVLTKTNTTSFTPTWDYQPATKKYVDDHAWAGYNAWEWISIGDVSMNARKWPCPEWWHVPSTSEWSFIETVLFNLWVVVREYSSGWRSNAIRYLHIPMAWFRINTWIANDGVSVELQASDWYVCFWDISDESDPDITVSNRIACSRGWWIRPFKDTYEAPTSSWTVVVWSLWSNWVFYNQTEWLISVSNWQTWYTMSDKNLWATVVYNYWDTINEANSWYFYQFWNNHWFPWVGNSSTVTVSTTAVDITWYWPNNYYNSDTFVWITWPQSQQAQWWIWDWSDLWWGVSWTISQENVISNTWVLSVNGQTWNVTIQTGSEQNLFIITEDIVTVSTSEDTWVAPYSTSYKYTNFDINANAGIEWKEWAIYTFVVDTEMVVASAYRNVRVKIWSWAYIPVMWTTAAAAGNSYFAKTAIRQFQYTTKYESGWALHVFTDSNTTYKAMTAAQATAWTATTALTISPSILKWAIETHAPVQSVNWSTWAVTVQATISDLSSIRTNATNWATVVSGDSWINYIIKVSTTAPASWTANNIITIVTD